MRQNRAVHELLEKYRRGELDTETAAAAIGGFRMDRLGEFACMDLGRDVRCGMPEVILAEGKDEKHLAAIVIRHAKTSGRCVVTRIGPESAKRIRALAKKEGIGSAYHREGRILVLGSEPAPEKSGGTVAIVTAGTSDIRVAEEARVIAEEMGCEVRTAYDVGAAGIHRLFPALKPLLAAQVFIVCAGREGTLPSVVAGLVDKPVIGVPVSVGYGYMGEGRAALASMLQSCSVLSVVNIDAGFVAGAFAARVARMGVPG